MKEQLRTRCLSSEQVSWSSHGVPDEGHREVTRRSNSSLEYGQEEQPEVFAQRFLRSYGLLHFIACRVLGDKERVPFAIQNCWQTACRNPPRFEFEGAFRSWLLRILIDEALAIRESHRDTCAEAAVVRAASLSVTSAKPRLGETNMEDR
jgi:DNA-directed RNA polymerase specialized sigma24 family protein